MDNLWQDISTAPKYDGCIGNIGPKIDILAKIWIAKKDEFEFKRFTDCYWREKFDNTPARWRGVEDGWHAVAWMPIPKIPKQWP